MKNFQTASRRWQLAARMCGERLFLAPDLRRRVVGEMAAAVACATCGGVSDPLFDGRTTCPAADRRAFSQSVALERLGELYLRLGAAPRAFRAFRAAALAALDGEAYDHGRVSLPARFLRIRFYRMLGRISECCAADARLRALVAGDRELAAEARRLGGGFL